MCPIHKGSYGYYYLDFRAGGKRYRISLKTKDRILASVKGKIKQREIEGTPTINRISIADFKTEYLEYSTSRKAWESRKADEYAFNKLKAFIKVKGLDEISVRDADNFVTAIKEKIRPATVNFYIRAIRSALNTAIRWGYLSTNPFSKISLIKFELPVPKILTLPEITEIISATKKHNPELAPLFEFYVLTGVRRSEALNLQWSDIDFEKNVIILRNTKGKRPRMIPIVPKIKSILSARTGSAKPFPYNPDFISHAFLDMAKQAKVVDVSLHDLRRSFSTYIQDLGMPALIVSKFIGHQDQSTTEKYYTGLDDDMIRGYFMRLSDKIFPP